MRSQKLLQKADRVAAAHYPPRGYAWYVLFVLLIIGITSYLDRNIVAVLMEPIKQDLQLTDTEVSLLQGMAFAVFYVAFGLPFGALVDRKNRRVLLAFGIALWSTMTAAGGLAESYWQLFAARAGVGIGEACLAPAAFSLIADYFPPSQRGRAMSVYNMSNYLGGGASMLLGGLVL
jgi:MFS family permease